MQGRDHGLLALPVTSVLFIVYQYCVSLPLANFHAVLAAFSRQSDMYQQIALVFIGVIPWVIFIFQPGWRKFLPAGLSIFDIHSEYSVSGCEVIFSNHFPKGSSGKICFPGSPEHH